MHIICWDNCHSHVARVLNNHKYLGKENWNMITVWWLVMTKGKYVSNFHLFMTYIGFIVLFALVILAKLAIAAS